VPPVATKMEGQTYVAETFVAKKLYIRISRRIITSLHNSGGQLYCRPQTQILGNCLPPPRDLYWDVKPLKLSRARGQKLRPRPWHRRCCGLCLELCSLVGSEAKTRSLIVL